MNRQSRYVSMAAAFTLLFCAGIATAAVDKVICVPWQGDVSKQHTAVSGQAVQLKCVVKTDATSAVYYKWVFGDGSESAVSTLTGNTKYNVETTHTYSAATGTPFTATLQVDETNPIVTPVSDFYLLKIEENNLDSKVNMSIDKGLWWLYKNQTAPNAAYKSLNGQPVTTWWYSNYGASGTASAVLAFEINNHKEGGNPNEDPYVDSVKGGLNWLVSGYYSSTTYPMLQSVAISSQTFGNPDTNGNMKGIQVRDYGYDPAYEGGQVMDALIASGTPLKDSGRDFDGDSLTDSYAKIVQDMVDAYSWGQYDDAGSYGGGWRYSWNSWPDNSACQWAAIGMIPAETEWGLTVPQWVKDRNNVWLAYSYSPASKWFGYTHYYDCVWSNCQGTRPSGMVQMVMSTPNYKTDYRWTGAEGWHADNWNWFRDSTYTYSKYAFVKSMRLSNTENLSSGLNWYRGSATQMGLAERLVLSQLSDGHWSNEGWGPLDTAWTINMLKPTLFAAAPTSCFTAAPNPSYPDMPVAFNPSCSGHSETGKDINNLTLFQWDWNNDGTYDASSATPTALNHAFSCAVLPCTYPVTLKVTDDSTPARTATYTLNISISNPPHPPVAETGGPYWASRCSNDSLKLSGAGSYDPNEGVHEAGCTTCPNDTITAWHWDLAAPLTFDAINKSGQVVTLSGAEIASFFSTPATYDIGLRVTDNTALAFPGSGQPNLNNSDFGKVKVDGGCICNLAARPKGGQVQLTWTHTGAANYDIYRSTEGPNSGFALIANDHATSYATYLDLGLVNGTRYYYRVVSNNGCGSSNVATAIPAAR